VLKKAVYGSWRNLLAARVRHWLNRNSRAGSKRNIMATTIWATTSTNCGSTRA
jgi:hypothetical protein